MEVKFLVSGLRTELHGTRRRILIQFQLHTQPAIVVGIGLPVICPMWVITIGMYWLAPQELPTLRSILLAMIRILAPHPIFRITTLPSQYRHLLQHLQ